MSFPHAGMIAMRIYGLKTCDTCRKAIRALPGARLVDVRDSPVPDTVLERAEARFGAALVNTRSTTWRGLDAGERDKAPVALIRAHPSVMKRPLIETGDTLYLGWSADVRAALGVG